MYSICRLSILLFVMPVQLFSQSSDNLYLNMEFGLGTTFVNVSNRNLSSQDFKSTPIPSFTFGFGIRYDFTEKLSGITGVSVFNHGYGTVYQYGEGNSREIKNHINQRFISLPVMLQTSFEIHKLKHLYFTVLSGIDLGIKAGNMPLGVGWRILNEQGDSVTRAILFYQNTNPITFNLVTGIGLEKKLKKSSRLGFNIFLKTGLLKSYDGRMEIIEYVPPLPYVPFGPIVFQQPADISSFFSMNTSVFIKFYYALSLRRNKADANNSTKKQGRR